MAAYSLAQAGPMFPMATAIPEQRSKGIPKLEDSPGERSRWDSAGSRINFKKCPRKRLISTSFCRGCDEHAIEPVTGEDAICDPRRRQGDRSIEFPLRIETANSGAVPMGDPDAALHVGRHSIGIAPFFVET